MFLPVFFVLIIELMNLLASAFMKYVYTCLQNYKKPSIKSGLPYKKTCPHHLFYLNNDSIMH